MLHLRRWPGIVYKRRYLVCIFTAVLTALVYYLIRWKIFCTNLEPRRQVDKLVSYANPIYIVSSATLPLLTVVLM